MSTTKPVIVFIPGAWHTPEGFTPLITLLSLAGYPCIPISLPSAGAHPSHPSFDEDVNSIRKTLTTLVEAGKYVVVVMHSGGSICGSESLSGLSKIECEQQGKEGGVVRLVYIGILLPEKGKSMFETFNAVMTSPELDPDFVREENQDYHVIAEVRDVWSKGNSSVTNKNRMVLLPLQTET